MSSYIGAQLCVDNDLSLLYSLFSFTKMKMHLNPMISVSK